MNTKKTKKDLDQSCQLESNKFVLEQISCWINSADSKISISYGIFSAIFAAITVYIATIIENHDWSNNKLLINVALLLFCISAALFFVSLCFYFVALSPKFAGKNKKSFEKISTKEISMIFYEDVSAFEDYNEYANYAQSLNEKEFNMQILRQIYFNSKICSNKMHKFRVGFIFLGSSITTNIISLIFFVLS